MRSKCFSHWYSIFDNTTASNHHQPDIHNCLFRLGHWERNGSTAMETHGRHVLLIFLLDHLSFSQDYKSAGRDPDWLSNWLLRLSRHSRRRLLPYRPRLPDVLLPGAILNHHLPWRHRRCPGKRRSHSNCFG